MGSAHSKEGRAGPSCEVASEFGEKSADPTLQFLQLSAGCETWQAIAARPMAMFADGGQI